MFSYKYSLVTILDTISETSMPLNEFVLYRLKKYPNIKQYVIVCDREENTNMQLPDELSIYYVEKNNKVMKRIMKKIVSENYEKNSKLIVHLHQIKSALMFYRVMIGVKKTYKVLFTVHSVYALRNVKYKISSVLCSLMADKIICVSESSYKTYSSVVKKIKNKKILYIKNGVDIDRIDESIEEVKSTKNNKNYRTLVYVGRLIPIKNQKFLVNILSEISECKLILVGAEDNSKEISNLIKNLKLEDRVKITGLIPRNQVFQILNDADIYVSTSMVEGLPVSVLEAMAAKLPVILSDIEPHKEVAMNSSSVKLVSLNNESNWIDTINFYLNLDMDNLKEIGFECRKCVVENFSLYKMHCNYDKEYETLISG